MIYLRSNKPKGGFLIITICFVLLTLYHIFLSSASVRAGDILFISDIARDMYLLQEIRDKGMILIGPRSSVGGLFHGPLWAYITYPGYVLGKGDPVMVGWFWIFLITVFLILSYIVTRKLFGTATAMMYTIFMSVYYIFNANQLFNPDGAMFLLPFYYFLFVRYFETQKLKYLIVHVLVIGLIIQFQMAVGLPLLVISIATLGARMIQKDRLSHIPAFTVILLPLSTFLLFDLRHEFILTKNVFRHLNADSGTHLFQLIIDRVKNILIYTDFVPGRPAIYQFAVTLISGFLLSTQLKQNRHYNKYLIFLIIFFGFNIISLINRYGLLRFYTYPMYSLTFMIFCSLVTSKYKKMFITLFAVIYILNIQTALSYVNSVPDFIRTDKNSWKGLLTVAETVYSGQEKEFGYFVYAPDIMGYGPRYAMDYARTVYAKNGFAFEKKPVTYLVLEPNALQTLFTSRKKFHEEKIHITKTPLQSREFENGYLIEKYNLSPEETAVAFDAGINPGLHYR